MGYFEAYSVGFQDVLDFDDLNMQYIFLGNYFDSGPGLSQTFCYLLAAKCRYPDRIFLIRGSEEVLSDELLESLLIARVCQNDSEAARLSESFKRIVDCLPGAAVLGNKILVTKRSLGPQFPDLDEIRQGEARVSSHKY